MARLDFRGGAAKCTASGSVTSGATSIALSGDTSGWPTGASSRNFVAILDRGVAGKMEKVLCSALAGGTLTIVTRGYDGTTAVAHDANCTVEHGINAGVFDDLSAHMYDDTRDDHSQYSLVDGTRAFSGLSAIAGSPGDIGTANAAGTAATLARSDHVHKIPDAGITAAKLADGAVTSAKILDGTIVAADIAAGTLTQALMASGLSIPIICTSSTRPGSPTQGMAIYETDTGKTLYYHGATDTWRPDWSAAWGVIGRASSTAGTAHVQNTEIAVLGIGSFAHVANRWIRLTATLRINNSSPNAACEVILRRAGAAQHRFDFGTEDGTRTGSESVVIPSVAGAAAWTVFTDISVGGGDLTLVSGQISQFVIEDVGPNGAPS